MKRIALYLFFAVGICHLAIAQTMRTVTSLGDELKENSGMAHYGGGILYFVNDGGNAAQVYRFDTTQNDFIAFNVTNATNTDWEDLATDDQKNLYIGDFGNNGNTRRDLKIYKSVNPEAVFANQLTVDTISFSYSNQSAFPPAANKLNFDCEAMVWYQDSLYLFTKNRTNPYDGWCYMYVLPDKPGAYVARLKDSVQFNASAKEFGWITAADVRGDSLILLSSNQVHLGTGFGAISLEAMDWSIYSVGFSQKEAVAFGAKSTDIFISDELNIIGNKLYYLNIGQTASVDELITQKFDVRKTSSVLRISLQERSPATIYVFSILGPQMLSQTFDKELMLSGNDLPAGTFIVQLFVGGENYSFKWAKTE